MPYEVAGQNRGANALENNPESLRNRLDQAQATLARCEDALFKIHQRLEPTPSPVPEKVKAIELSISHYALEINNSASRLISMLEELATKLG